MPVIYCIKTLNIKKKKKEGRENLNKYPCLPLKLVQLLRRFFKGLVKMPKECHRKHAK